MIPPEILLCKRESLTFKLKGGALLRRPATEGSDLDRNVRRLGHGSPLPLTGSQYSTLQASLATKHISSWSPQLGHLSMSQKAV